MDSLLLFVILVFVSANAVSTELYRYQDSNGRWVFGDKKSLGGKKSAKDKAEIITIDDELIKKVRPELVSVSANKRSEIKYKLTNPLPVSIQHWLAVKGQKGFFTSLLAKPHQELKLNLADHGFRQKNLSIEHFYLLGEPMDKPAVQIIPLPYSTQKRFRVSQGFNGRYSHSGRGNRYALDIAMPIGESILAVKSGVVADAADNFSIGGAANYFLDKANHITVMHDDGSYAIYAHILYGSLDVQIGDTVQQGQVIARVGNTGFSTGPHLHFVMRYNSGQGAYSIPFKFQTAAGIKLPKQGSYYLGEEK